MQVQSIHIEISRRCNAACPQCARNFHGAFEKSMIRNENVSLKTFKEWFPEEVLKDIHTFSFCGNLGDPGMNNDLIPIISYILNKQPRTRINVNTNGSMRKPMWWKMLALALTSGPRPNHKSRVIFAIDGTDQETHEFHRQNTRLDRILENAKAYIEAGGRAAWQFIPFNHNKHQEEQARKMADEMGFQEFHLRPSNRFGDNGHSVFRPNGEFRGELHHVSGEKKSSEIFTVEQLKEFIPEYNVDMDIDFSDIKYTVSGKTDCHCDSVNMNEIYVAANGDVSPCCLIGHARTEFYKNEESKQLYEYLGNGKSAQYNLNNHSLEEIMNKVFMKKVYQGLDMNQETPTLKFCAASCNKCPSARMKDSGWGLPSRERSEIDK